MTNSQPTQDTELFELCEQVYEATGWGEPELPCWIDNATKKHAQPGYPKVTKYVGIRGKWEYGKQYGLYIMYPLYTSDYLLEKLKQAELTILLRWNRDMGGRAGMKLWDGKWCAGTFEMRQGDYPVGDTALITLLKLTLALHEACQLTNAEDTEEE